MKPGFTATQPVTAPSTPIPGPGPTQELDAGTLKAGAPGTKDPPQQMPCGEKEWGLPGHPVPPLCPSPQMQRWRPIWLPDFLPTKLKLCLNPRQSPTFLSPHKGPIPRGRPPMHCPLPKPGTCTMVSRFCRDVETELMTEEGPMVTTLMWWEGGGAGAGTITVGWWVGAGVGRSCKTEALSLSTKVLGAAPSLLSATEGVGRPSKTISLCPLPGEPPPITPVHRPPSLAGGCPVCDPSHPSYFKNEEKVAWRGALGYLRLHGPSLSRAKPALHT